MFGTVRSSWLLVALLAFVALASALSIDEVIHLDGIEAYLHHGEKRQAPGTGSSTPDPTPSVDTTKDTPSATPTQKPTPSPTPTEETTTDNPEPTPTPSNPPTSDGSTRPTAPPATSNKPPSDPPSTSKSQSQITTTRPLLATSTQPYTTVITTVSDGRTSELTSVGTSTGTFTTGSVVETTTASPQENSSSSGSSSSGGLSENSKKIIGGVVGGVGGAILLGGIAIVCWRIWGRKNRVSEDDADLMANTGAALGDKPQSNASPFQSNLEQYHNPGGRPNAAANF